MEANAVDAIDDVPADDADAHRKERHDDTDGNVPENDSRSGLPDEVENGRNILERAQTVAPGIARRARSFRSGRRDGRRTRQGGFRARLDFHLLVVHG